MAKSYYAILGISSMAGADEIRAAYRRLAKTYHPDHYSGSSDIFRQVQEAYNVLGNAERRRQYERQVRKTPLERPSPPPQGRRNIEPLIPETPSWGRVDLRPMRPSPTMPPSLDAVFDWMWGNFSSLRPTSFDRVRSMSLEVPISLAQSRQGGTVSIVVPARASCPICCGCGSIGAYECCRCAGEGIIAGDLPLAIALPPGISDGDEMILPLNRYGVRDLHLTVVFRVGNPFGR